MCTQIRQSDLDLHCLSKRRGRKRSILFEPVRCHLVGCVMPWIFCPQGRRQPKTLILLTNVDQKSFETVFDCQLSPDRRQMAIENTVSSDFDPCSSIVKSVFDCRMSGGFQGADKPFLLRVLSEPLRLKLYTH